MDRTPGGGNFIWEKQKGIMGRKVRIKVGGEVGGLVLSFEKIQY